MLIKVLLYMKAYLSQCERDERRELMSAGIVDIQRQLIKKAKLGDTKAFSQLYAEIYKDLYRFALYMTKHTQDAEDAVSEAVISAYENISGLKKENSFKSWMFTILNNECKKILRKNGNTSNQVSEEDAKNLGAEEIDFAQRHDVKKAFESLEEEEQTIVAFSVFGGYRSEEIAEMLGTRERSDQGRAVLSARCVKCWTEWQAF